MASAVLGNGSQSPGGSSVGTAAAENLPSAATPTPFYTRGELVSKARQEAENAISAAEAVKNRANVNLTRKQKAYNQAVQAIKNAQEEGLEISDIIPIDFKGDGLGRSAGFGYRFNKKKAYGNFAHGFPFKYYRVFGDTTNNALQGVKYIQGQLHRIQNTKSRRKQAQLQAIAKAREENQAKKYRNKLIADQERNLYLASREFVRGARGSAGVALQEQQVREQAEKVAVNAAIKRVENVLSGTATPMTPREQMLARNFSGLRFVDLDDEYKQPIINNAKRSVRLQARRDPGLGSRLGRAYNTASYALSRRKPTVGTQFRSQYYSGVPANATRSANKPTAAASSAAAATAPAPRPSFGSRLRSFFTRKSKPANNIAASSA